MTRTYKPRSPEEVALYIAAKAAADKARADALALAAAQVKDNPDLQDMSDRMEAARLLIVGEILVGDDRLAAIIPCPIERFVWMKIHALALGAAGMLPGDDGPTPLGRVYYPALVGTYIRQCGGIAAIAIARTATTGVAK